MTRPRPTIFDAIMAVHDARRGDTVVERLDRPGNRADGLRADSPTPRPSEASVAEIAEGLAEIGTGGTPAFIRGYNRGYDDAYEHTPVDPERLAEAMAACEGVNWPKRWTTNDSHDFSWVARQVAAAYRRLEDTDEQP